MHDLASADSRDFSRSACFESKAPTALAFLLLNLPTLAGYGTSGTPAGGAGGQVRAVVAGGRGMLSAEGSAGAWHQRLQSARRGMLEAADALCGP